jgi:hypothetical protein
MQTELFQQKINEFCQIVPNAFVCYDDGTNNIQSAQQLLDDSEMTAEDKMDLTLTKISQGKFSKSNMIERR